MLQLQVLQFSFVVMLLTVVMINSSVEHWSDLFLLWITFGPLNIILNHMVMMMVALHFNWNMNRLNNSFCMEMSMMFNWNVNANPEEW